MTPPSPPPDDEADGLPLPVRIYRDVLKAAVRLLANLPVSLRGDAQDDLVTVATAGLDWMGQLDRVRLARTAVADAADVLASIPPPPPDPRADLPPGAYHHPDYRSMPIDRPPPWVAPSAQTPPPPPPGSWSPPVVAAPPGSGHRTW
ncbi:hypothetical protein [Euzebya sp.]|uniref:hypothetical protein n=1 Tax=Euzebya sp. TaxID=1971409 RepID=UPI003519D07F